MSPQIDEESVADTKKPVCGGQAGQYREVGFDSVLGVWAGCRVLQGVKVDRAVKYFNLADFSISPAESSDNP